MSTGCKSSHNGLLDVSRSNGGLSISCWIGQLSCLMIFSTSLSVAAFLRRAGGSMLASTGSHGKGVERRVPEMRRMVEFNCTSTWLMWAERDQTVQFKVTTECLKQLNAGIFTMISIYHLQSVFYTGMYKRPVQRVFYFYQSVQYSVMSMSPAL